MSIRKVVALVIFLFACSAVAVVLIGRAGSRGQHASDSSAIAAKMHVKGRPFAYTTKRQLVVMRGQQVVARVRRIFNEFDSAQNKVVWTNNGSFVALLKDVSALQEPPAQEQLITVNVRTGAVSYQTCPGCYDLSPVGQAGILTAANAANTSSPVIFKVYTAGSRSQPRPVGLGSAVNHSEYAALLASSRTSVLIAQPASGGQELELAGLNGTPHTDLGNYLSNDYMLAAVAEGSSGQVARTAVALNSDPGECVAQFPIVVFNSDGTSVDTDMSAAIPPRHYLNVNAGIQVNDLWAGPAGDFYATITSWTCDNSKRSESGKERLFSGPRVWRLAGRVWTEDSSQPATMMRQISTTQRIVLVIPSCVGPHPPPDPVVTCNVGTLYSRTGQTTTVIARHVISISAAAPQQLAAPSPAQVPVLGQLSGYFAQGAGFGRIRPDTIYNGGDPTGLVQHIHWTSWGRARAVGTGIGLYEAPNHGVSQGTKEHATIVAFNLGNCEGERMYRAVEWYFPQHGETFNSHRYENVCTGKYQPSP
jgi:hypothetical protein